MSDFAHVSIPRWRWRTFAADLSWLRRRLPPQRRGGGERLEETHLVCLHSSHHAWLAGDALELCWRKEVGPEGFELWDTVLSARLPFARASVARLFSAWGLAEPAGLEDYRTIAGFLDGPIAATPTVRPVVVVRRCRAVLFEGIECSLESLAVLPGIRLQSLAVEHEDPALVARVLRGLGFEAGANTSFLQGLKDALGLTAIESGSWPWPRKSNASTW